MSGTTKIYSGITNTNKDPCLQNSLMAELEITNRTVIQQEHLQSSGSTAAGPRVEDDGTLFCILNRRVSLLAFRMAAAEFIGTFILTFCASGIKSSKKYSDTPVGILESAFNSGLAVVLVMFSLGHISGAHVNPSITIAFTVLGGFPWSKVLYYVPAQVLGSVVGAYVGKLVYNMEADFATTKPLHGDRIAFFAEMMGGLFVMFLIASLSKLPPSVVHISPFIVGAAVALSILLTEPVSGGSMNPARSLGPAVISGSFGSIWVYVLAPTAGAVAGALLYKILNYNPPRVSAAVANTA